jgi:metallo-beta-lactamase class B
MKKVTVVLVAIMILFPVTLVAGSKQNGKFRCGPSRHCVPWHLDETPINPPNVQEDIPEPQRTIGPGIGPYQLFDNFYYIGVEFINVGVFIVKTKAGLILIDAANDLVDADGYWDCAVIEDKMAEAGLYLSDVKYILLSHEHIDHYGCVNHWRELCSPNVKVAMSRIGWDNLRTWPVRRAFGNTRPDKIDMYLYDGQTIRLGGTKIKVVATPGHSMGCMSFIVPVKEGRKRHVVGIMGGSGVQKSWGEAYMYWASVEYFKHKCDQAKCDVGLNVHTKNWPAGVLDAFLARQPGEPNPLVLGADKFDELNLDYYRGRCLDRFQWLIDNNVQ